MVGFQKLAILPMRKLRELEKETMQVFVSSISYPGMRNRHQTEAEEKYQHFLWWLAKHTRELWEQLYKSSRNQTDVLGNLLMHMTAAENQYEFFMEDNYNFGKDQPIFDQLQRHELLCSEVLVRYRRLSFPRRFQFWQLEGEHAALIGLWEKVTMKAKEVLCSAPLSIGNTGRLLEPLGWFLRSHLTGLLTSIGIGEPVTSIDTLGRTAAHEWLDSVQSYLGREPSLDGFKQKINLGLQDRDLQDFLGRGLLHIACQKRWYSGIAWLLEQGANPGTVTGYGSLPIHYAAAHGSRAICKLLLSHRHKFDIDTKDNAGLSARDYATIGEYADIVELLSEDSFEDNDKTVANEATTAHRSFHESSQYPEVEPSVVPVQPENTVENNGAALVTRSTPGNMALTGSILPASLTIRPTDIMKPLKIVIEYILSQSLYCDKDDIQVVSDVIKKLHWDPEGIHDLPTNIDAKSSDFIHSMQILVGVEAGLRHATHLSLPMTSFEDVATYTVLTAMLYAQDHVESLAFEVLELEVVEKLIMNAVKGSL
jgi:ankyrin repeat protein